MKDIGMCGCVCGLCGRTDDERTKRTNSNKHDRQCVWNVGIDFSKRSWCSHDVLLPLLTRGPCDTSLCRKAMDSFRKHELKVSSVLLLVTTTKMERRRRNGYFTTSTRRVAPPFRLVSSLYTLFHTTAKQVDTYTVLRCLFCSWDTTEQKICPLSPSPTQGASTD